MLVALVSIRPEAQDRPDRHQEPLKQLLVFHGAEAIATVHRPVSPWQERYLSVNSTLGADHRMHLPLATTEPTSGPTTEPTAGPAAVSSLLVSTSASASRAAGGLIGEPLGSKKLLFADCEDKNSATVPTCQVFV